jgi:hypothetical protein
MNLKFLKTLVNEDHEEFMTSEEMKSYLNLLYKKCNKKTKEEFMEYLSKKFPNVESKTPDGYADEICKNKKRCDVIIHKLEELSNKIDENSLSFLLNKTLLQHNDNHELENTMKKIEKESSISYKMLKNNV